MANTKTNIVIDGPLLRGWMYTNGNKCSDPGCLCQSDPSKRHGLYHRWSGTVNGKLMTRSISKEAAEECRRRIENYKAVLKKIDELVNDEIAKEPWKSMGKDPE